MKIKASVLSAEDIGDRLKITAQGRVPGAADWRPMETITVTVPMNDRNRRALHVGRSITMTINPERTT